MPRLIPRGKWEWNMDETSPAGDWREITQTVSFRIDKLYQKRLPRFAQQDSDDMLFNEVTLQDLLVNTKKRGREGEEEEEEKIEKIEKRTRIAICWLDIDFDAGQMTIHGNDNKVLSKVIKIRRVNEANTDETRVTLDKQCGVESLSPFPGPFLPITYGYGESPYTVKELQMMQLSSAIRSKSDWETKYHDNKILEKWKQEANCEPALFKYVISELAYYKSLKDGPLEPSTVDGVWQSDTLISGELREALLNEVVDLENVADTEKDWHPGSDNKVLDLVHPSLYCFVAKVTRECEHAVVPPMKFIGGGEVRKQRKVADNENTSKKYQWLPTDFQVDKSGSVSILSYINNLHPGKHQRAYRIITKILENFIPMFEKVLIDLANPRQRRYLMPTWGNWDKDDSDRVIYPPIPSFSPPSPPLQIINLRGRRLQVIVKLANIVLTPENPTYDGGVWHVEGMTNEKIVASGIYYYDSQNISESMLGFRVGISEPEYQQNDDTGVKEVYGLVDAKELNQQLGEVITKSGRCISFPNLYQHKVSPFTLLDKTKPGHRKILVFFLVDPACYILSTMNVPPQQESWRLESLKPFYPWNTMSLYALESINKLTGMTLDEAKKHRTKLMKERKFFTNGSANSFERPFSLCEH